MCVRPAALISVFLSISLPMLAAEQQLGTIGRGRRAVRSAARHFILRPQHVLSDAERSDLAVNGCLVQRALPNGQYLVRIASDSPVDETDLRIRSLTPLTANQKIDSSAYRLAAQARPFASLKILFHDDVSLDEARRAIEDAGGSPDMRFDFGPLRTLTARVPSSSLFDLADDERVLLVYGMRWFRATAHNATAALLSNVTPLYSAPYNLTGNGVVLSYSEPGHADSTHPEFQGRLQVEFTCPSSDTGCSGSDSRNHATHVAGTMIAAGLNADAKGMAPHATLHGYYANSDTWLDDKATAIKNIGAVADNNSWGYELGWGSAGSTGWTWEGADELIGGYEGTVSAVLDHTALTNGVLIDYSAGNDASNSGPLTAPFRHNHANQDDPAGAATKDIYCYSANGSGTDCPASTCTTPGKMDKWGDPFCEASHHPTHTPWGSIGFTASVKNIVSVGATDSGRVIGSFSSRGPARDGRVKPEIVAKGAALFSTITVGQSWSTGWLCSPSSAPGYACAGGTSMAAPAVTGSMALLAEQWRKLNGGASPGPLVLKTLAIAGADDLGNTGPDYTYGFGFMNTRASVDLIIADGGVGKRIKQDNAAQGSQFDYPLTISQTQNLRAVLSWFDPEAVPINTDTLATKTLINDLDLRVTDPNGNTVLPYVLDMNNPGALATRGVNTVDNTEEVEIKGAAPGTYHVIVSGTTVTANPPQPFVVIANADFTAPLPPCTNPAGPNGTLATAYGPLPTNSMTQARVCGSSDINYFRFTPNASGTTTIKVTASDTPLTVQFGTASSDQSSLLSIASTTVAAGSTQSLTASTTASVQYFISVKANGTLGADRGYTVSTTYPFTWPARRRATRR